MIAAFGGHGGLLLPKQDSLTLTLANHVANRPEFNYNISEVDFAIPRASLSV